jgi:hypothetical protein
MLQVERFVLWYRGNGTMTASDVEPLLPEGAHLLRSAPESLFLVEANRHALESAFDRRAGWIVGADTLPD